MNMETKRAKAERLRELHRRGSILVLPNAWDPLSARAFESCGFPAGATTRSSAPVRLYKLHSRKLSSALICRPEPVSVTPTPRALACRG
jgi:hypothetical protein